MPSKSKRPSDLLVSPEDSRSWLGYEPLEAGGARVVYKGTNGKDNFDGSGRDETVYGLGGDDVMWGLGGDDYLDGGDGDDYLVGQAGTDRLFGRKGDDYLSGSDRDRVEGGAGDDRFSVSDQAVAIGGSGNDVFDIDNDSPKILGGSGIDTIVFSAKSKHFQATYEDDVLLLRANVDYYRPKLLLDDKTIERISFKDLDLDITKVSAPEISYVYAKERIDEGDTATASIGAIYGKADPFSRITLMYDGIALGTCVTDAEGEWYMREFYRDLPEGPVTFTAVADYGSRTQKATSAEFTFEYDLPATEMAGENIVEDLDEDEVTHFVGRLNATSSGAPTAVGDVNGDGIADWLVPATETVDNVSTNSAYVVYGRAGGIGDSVDDRSLLNIWDMTADRGFRIGLYPGYYFSPIATSAGDLNGDGIGDLILSSREDDTYSIQIVYMGVGAPGTIDGDGKRSIDLASLSDEQLLTIQLRSGVAEEDSPINQRFPATYESLRSVGDVNGDGIADLVIGMSDNQGSEAYLIYGGAELGTTSGGKRFLDIETLDASQGVHISGYGTTIVEAAGDVNGDGVDDFVIGSRYNNIPAVAVVFGSEAGIGAVSGSNAELDVRYLDPDQGFLIKDDIYGFQSDVDVESLGDFNGDGHDDLFIQSSDRMTVLFGSGSGFGEVVGGQRQVMLGDITAEQGFVIDVEGSGSVWGVGPSISRIGDFNGDGFDDLAVVRETRERDDFYRAFIVLGTDEPLGAEDDGKITLTLKDLTEDHARAFTSYFDRVYATGDLNDDGYDDFAFGLSIVYGGPTASVAPLTRTGTSAADNLVGRAGDDTLEGNGGADIFRAGRGNDTIAIGDANFARIAAGLGNLDTVAFDGAGITLDARDFGVSQLRGIEAFDLTGTGDNTLVLTAYDVFQLSTNRNGAFTAAESGNSLVVTGNDGDTLELIDHPDGGWTLSDSGVRLDGTNGGDFDIYQLVVGSRVLASVAVSEDVAFVN